MPLRDHFRPPLDRETSWEGLHGGWPMMIVAHLAPLLPDRYVAAPRVHTGAFVEVDVATYSRGDSTDAGSGNGAVATLTWAPPRPTFDVAAILPAEEEYEVRVFDQERNRRLVAAIELVSPANKDRLQHRRMFVAKCVALLQQGVSVTFVDLVTTRHSNLYAEMLELIGQADPSLAADPPLLYAVACRGSRHDGTWGLAAWAYTLALGDRLPTLPLWLSDDFALPLELEASYEETCRLLRIP